MNTRRSLAWLVALLLWMGCAVQAAGADYEARVVKVIDGDTLETIDSARRMERVRLSGIDAPERNHAYGTQAKKRLADLVGRHRVTVDWDKRDRYGRIVGKVMVGDRDLGLTLVREGYAWWYRQYADEQSPVDRLVYGAAETVARKEKRGLWRDPKPMAPWDFRR